MSLWLWGSVFGLALFQVLLTTGDAIWSLQAPKPYMLYQALNPKALVLRFPALPRYLGGFRKDPKRHLNRNCEVEISHNPLVK